MKTSLLAITLVGVTAAMAVATPARNLNKRRAEKKRDAAKAEVTAPAQVAAPARQAATSSAAPAASGSTTAPSASAPTPAPVTTPVVPGGPSKLVREGKPPSRRFFSRVRTDKSRQTSKDKRDAAAPVQEAQTATGKKNLIYRRTWGARSRHRPR